MVACILMSGVKITGQHIIDENGYNPVKSGNNQEFSS